MRFVVFLTLLTAGILFSGCASYSTNVKPDVTLAKYERVWVKTNLNDNHGLAQFISDALNEHGVESDCGPLTMMPTKMQAIVSYKDSWTWDFKDHMTGLELTVHDTKVDYPIATATYRGPMSMTTSPHDVVGELVQRLFGEAKKK